MPFEGIEKESERSSKKINKYEYIGAVRNMLLATVETLVNINYLGAATHRSLKRKMWKKEIHELYTVDKLAVSVDAIHSIPLRRLAFTNIVGLIKQITAPHTSYVLKKYEVLDDNGNHEKHRIGAYSLQRRVAPVFLTYFATLYGLECSRENRVAAL